MSEAVTLHTNLNNAQRTKTCEQDHTVKISNISLALDYKPPDCNPPYSLTQISLQI